MDFGTGAPAQGRQCYNCGDTTHQARECPTKGNPTCYNCGNIGHLSRECTEPAKEKLCFQCGATGHLSRECPSGGGGGGQECYKCGKVGHIARSCPEAGGYYGGQTTNKMGHYNQSNRSNDRSNFGQGSRNPSPNKKQQLCDICKSADHLRLGCPAADYLDSSQSLHDDYQIEVTKLKNLQNRHNTLLQTNAKLIKDLAEARTEIDGLQRDLARKERK